MTVALKGSFAMRHADDSATLLPRLEPGEQGLADDTNYIWMRDYSDNYFQLYTTGPVGALSGSLTSGKIPVANGIHSVADSIITQSGTAISIAGSLALTSTTDATSISTGGFHTASGAGIAKALWVGGLANIAGAVTLQSTLDLTSTGTPVLTVGGNTTTTPSIVLNGAAANRKRIRFQTAGIDRWNIRQGNTAESGSDAGSEFELVAFNDAGAGIDSPISIVRATGGIITLVRPVALANNLSVTGTITQSNTTDATSISTGAWHTAGGASVTKALWVGGLANIAGAVTLQNTFTQTSTSSTPFNSTITGGSANYTFKSDHFTTFHLYSDADNNSSGSDASLRFYTDAASFKGEIGYYDTDGTMRIMAGGTSGFSGAAGGLIVSNTGSCSITGALTIGGAATTTGVHTFTAAPVFSSATASQAVFTNGSKALVSNPITGTGSVVMSASPTLTGTIGAASLTLSGTLAVTGIATFTAAPIVSSLTASSLVATDGSKVLTSSVSGLSPTFTGLTLSGKLTVQSNTSDAITVGTGSSAPGITINGAAGNYRTLTFQTNGAIRWVISTTSASELGSNAGSLFDLAAYTDAGSLIDHPISIGRDSGNSISFSRAGVFQGALSTNKKLTGLFFTVSSLGSQTISGTVGTPDTITCGNLGRTVITPSSVPNDYANIDTASATDGQLLHITNASATVVLYLTNIYNGPILLNPKEGKTFSYNSTLGWLTA